MGRAEVPSIASDDFAALREDEAQATLEAIRRGEVDALMVDGAGVVLLESASAPYRELVEHMRHGVLTITEDCRVSYANARFRSMVGAAHDTLTGLPAEELVVESDRERLAALCRAPGHDQAELRLRSRAGQPVAVQASMIRHHGQRMFVFTDLTERKRHLASDELTRKFLGLLAAEFEDMLATIDRSTGALKRLEGAPPGSDAPLEAIERTTEMMALLVRDLRLVNPTE